MSFNAVLVDVDRRRCTDIDEGFHGSELYVSWRSTSKLHRLCTVGLLAAWVLNPTGKYHQRKSDDLPSFIKRNHLYLHLFKKVFVLPGSAELKHCYFQ